MPLIRKGPGVPSPDVKLDAERALAGLGADQADERWRAARALGGFPHAAASLGAALAIEPDARVREAMFTSLARMGADESLAALVPLIRSDDASRRTGAMDALKSMPAVLPSALALLLRDDDPDVRVLACDLARELPSMEATTLLAPVLGSEPQVNVCAAAVDVIADIGTAAALPALRACAHRFASEPFLGFAIDIACERIGSKAAPLG
jgi:HEAT repeat protein